MAYLARKIVDEFWSLDDGVPSEAVTVVADPITNDMRTQSHELSVWRIETLNDIREAVVALTAMYTRLQYIDMVAIDEAAILSRGLTITEELALTPVVDLRDTHRNISNLTARDLGSVAICVFDSIKEGRVWTFTDGEVKDLLNEAISKGRLDKGALEPGVRKKLS